MNLEDLKKRTRALTESEWAGQKIYLRKIGAADGMSLVSRILRERELPLTPEQDREATLDFQATVISKSLANASGELTLDSDEGRSELKLLPFAELVELGDMCLRFSGMASQKKSTATE